MRSDKASRRTWSGNCLTSDFHPAILIFETFRPWPLAMPAVTRSNYFASSVAHVKRFAFHHHVLLSFS
jgi:hypothetical protein